MASSKAPRHDFAPAWLKIPDHAQKPTGTKSSEHSDKRNYYRGKDERHVFDYSFGGSKPRPHSLEEAYYENQAYYNYYNGYPGLGFRGGPPPYRDMKYPPHNGRYMNGYPPYFDSGFGWDMYHSGGERFAGGSGGRGPPTGGNNGGRARHKSDKDSRKSAGGGDRLANGATTTDTVVTTAAKKEEEEKGGKEKRIEEEFPSLGGEGEGKGDVSPADKSKPSSVWDKYSRVKILQTNKEPNGIKKSDNCNRDVKQNNTHIYKALVPNKGKITKRGTKENPKVVTPSKDINSNNSVFSRHNKENTAESPSTPPSKSLTPSLVSQHRKPSDKKSDFLKALKQDSHDLSASPALANIDHKQELPNGCVGVEGVGVCGRGVVNGLEELTLEAGVELTAGQEVEEKGADLLSSSLEAEQRLLREMGWSEDDEQNTVTEEMMREMQQLKQDLKQLKQQKNGLKRSLPKTWSPQHHGLYSPAPLTNGGHLSPPTDSSDSDSDIA